MKLTDKFSALAPRYEAVLSDVWGVLHNGVAAFPEAGDALVRFRAQGGTVVLISNAPRPGGYVARMLERLGVPREAYDDIVTSGDVTRDYVAGRPGGRVFHIGPERDHSVFTGLDAPFAPLEAADYAICTGLFDDDTETPEDYRALLGALRARGLFMVCANPDKVVERGDRLVYCAGAVADLYGELGGEVLYAGKPYRPIYDLARAKVAAARGREVALQRMLAIGDSVRTDLRGAVDLGVDCLFVTAGIHAEELGHREDPDPTALAAMFAAVGQLPKAVTRRLAW
ncbi:MAG: TIGR01459 family HAD-type hydrolase [Xanthobacteraceae bacterium]|nr:TIGR01459 family HAD-type hydrolase [Xanthobacteraceae bacterium]PWB59307.1 MAG: TIGR01459 family HAD-type hydrolase [Bradyrhizobiaceae bacterium]